ncbi:MAG: hypothetical protein RLZZ455_733 [Candidatus Parcubacteria bacterium]|jgi:tryptophan-rich sensory protein
MMQIQYRKLLISLLLPFLAGAVGSSFTFDSLSNWYPTLIKPSFQPPNYLFGPVWTTLYFLMGVAFYDVWVKHTGRSSNWLGAVTFFLIQIILNTLWSIVFFGLHQIGVALLVILVLWFMILLCIIAFSRVSKIAAILLVPYILWVSFASVLNAAIYFLNR